MRHLVGSLLVVSALAACSKSDTGAAATSATAAAAAPAPAPMTLAQKIAGSWSARAHPAGTPASDTGFAFTIISDSSLNSIAITGKDTVRYHRTAMTDSTFVVESAPHMDAMLKAEATDRAEGKFAADSMWGTFETKPTKGSKKPLAGTWSAHRKS